MPEQGKFVPKDAELVHSSSSQDDEVSAEISPEELAAIEQKYAPLQPALKRISEGWKHVKSVDGIPDDIGETIDLVHPTPVAELQDSDGSAAKLGRLIMEVWIDDHGVTEDGRPARIIYDVRQLDSGTLTITKHERISTAEIQASRLNHGYTEDQGATAEELSDLAAKIEAGEAFWDR